VGVGEGGFVREDEGAHPQPLPHPQDSTLN